jgi:hypothetical protein
MSLNLKSVGGFPRSAHSTRSFVAVYMSIGSFSISAGKQYNLDVLAFYNKTPAVLK